MKITIQKQKKPKKTTVNKALKVRHRLKIEAFVLGKICKLSKMSDCFI